MRYNKTQPFDIVYISCSGRNIKVFSSWQVFDERILLYIFLHHEFYVGVNQRSPTLSFMNKGLYILKSLCNETHHKSFGLGSISVNEVHKCIFLYFNI